MKKIFGSFWFPLSLILAIGWGYTLYNNHKTTSTPYASIPNSSIVLTKVSDATTTTSDLKGKVVSLYTVDDKTGQVHFDIKSPTAECANAIDAFFNNTDDKAAATKAQDTDCQAVAYAFGAMMIETAPDLVVRLIQVHDGSTY